MFLRSSCVKIAVCSVVLKIFLNFGYTLVKIYPSGIIIFNSTGPVDNPVGLPDADKFSNVANLVVVLAEF